MKAKVGDRVKVVKMDEESTKYVGNLVGKKGRIIELLENSKGEIQGAKVRFAGGKIWSFYWHELKLRR